MNTHVKAMNTMDLEEKLKQKMPVASGFLEDVVEAFGEGGVEIAFAMESGTKLGGRSTAHTSEVWWDERGVSHARRSKWMDDAQALARRWDIEIPEASVDDIDGLEVEAEALRRMIENMKGGAR